MQQMEAAQGDVDQRQHHQMLACQMLALMAYMEYTTVAANQDNATHSQNDPQLAAIL